MKMSVSEWTYLYALHANDVFLSGCGLETIWNRVVFKALYGKEMGLEFGRVLESVCGNKYETRV